MNKQTIIGFVLIGLIFIGFSWYSQKEAAESQMAKMRRDSIANAEAMVVAANKLAAQPNQATIASTDVPSEITANNTISNGTLEPALVAALEGTPEYYTMENDKMIVTISSKGAAIVSVELKNYKTYENEPLMLFNKLDSEFSLNFFTRQNIKTSNFYFTPVTASKSVVVSGDNGKGELAMRLYFDESAYIEYLYTMTSSDMVDFNVKFVNTDRYISPAQNSISINWSNNSPRQERGYDYENQYTTFAYKFPDVSSIEEATMSKDSKSEDIKTKVKWVAFKQQFFSSIIVANDDFSDATLGFKTLSPQSGYIKNFSAMLSVPYSPQTQGYSFSFYFGPNSYNTMKAYDQDFQKLIPLGWSLFRWITRFIIIPTFDFLGGFIDSYGLIILLLTIFIKLIIFPFTYRSYLSMAKMRLIKPEVDEVNAKFPNKEDAMKKQQAIMELYRKAGVNPMGGCLPMLFQLPIIIAMFRFFPASIELRGESFWWAKDLSSYDSIWTFPEGFSIPFYGDHISLWAILMAVSMYFTSKINMQQSAATSSQMPGMNFMMLYVMPVMLLVWFNNYSAALCYYYFLSNIITLLQTIAIRRFVNEDKLHARMKENAKKPVKKSGLQQRMEAMAKQQQEMKKK